MELVDGGGRFPFCPAKVFRDDMATVRACEDAFAEWKSGNLPGGARSASEAMAVDLEIFTHLVLEWERQTRLEGQRFLVGLVSALFSGGKSKNGGSRGSQD